MSPPMMLSPLLLLQGFRPRTFGNQQLGLLPTSLTLVLESTNLLLFQALVLNYSAGSTPFREIVGPRAAAYNRRTLVGDSPSGSG